MAYKTHEKYFKLPCTPVAGGKQQMCFNCPCKSDSLGYKWMEKRNYLVKKFNLDPTLTWSCNKLQDEIHRIVTERQNAKANIELVKAL